MKAAAWTTRLRRPLRWALPALLLGVVPGVLRAAPATRPTAVEADVPAAPALVAEVETSEADAQPAAAGVRRAPSTRPADAPARGDRPERRRLTGNPSDVRELDAYLYTPPTARAADDPYRLTDPLLYSMPWGHPAPPPYPPPPLPTRIPHGYGGSWYDSGGTVVYAVEPRAGGAPAAPSGPVRAVRIQAATPRIPPGAIALPPSPRGPLPPGVPVPRARPPRPPGT